MLLQWKENFNIFLLIFFFQKLRPLQIWIVIIFFAHCFQSFKWFQSFRVFCFFFFSLTGINDKWVSIYILSWVFLISKCLLPEICVILASNQIRDWDLFSPSLIGYHNRVRGIILLHDKWLASIAIVFPVALILAVLILVFLKHGWSWRRLLPPFKNLSSLRYANRQIKLGKPDSIKWLVIVLVRSKSEIPWPLFISGITSLIDVLSILCCLTLSLFFSCKLT